MKGVIIIPTFYKTYKRMRKGSAIKRNAMYDKLCKKYNFSVLYTDSPQLDNYDVAIISSVPYHNRPNIPPGLLNTNKCKLIGEFGDLQCWENEECLKNKKKLFSRYDILIGSYYYLFRKWYPQYLHKYIYWPNYFGPYERYTTLTVNPNSKMRCLLIGVRYKAYLRRNYVIEKAKTLPDNALIDIVNGIPFDEYPKYINSYFCALALPGKLNVPVAKYFEIPAAGSLLLATEVKELAVCGFKPNVHYIPVTKDNVFDKIKEVLSHPNDYIEIRNRGSKFVRENHSNLNRFGVFEEIFNRLYPGEYKSLLRKKG